MKVIKKEQFFDTSSARERSVNENVENPTFVKKERRKKISMINKEKRGDTNKVEVEIVDSRVHITRT